MKTLKVQKLLTEKAQSGVGRVWQTVAVKKRTAVAEMIARSIRIEARHQRPVLGYTAPVRIV